MLQLRRPRIEHWRAAVIVICCLFVGAQAIGTAHAADLKLHGGEVACQVCAATGHAAAPPSVATGSETPIEFVYRAVAQDVFASPVQPTYSPHAARAPPAFL